MVLLARTHQRITYLPLSNQIPHDAEVFQIRYTGEVFADYDTYWERLRIYNQRIWECEETGKSGLTYEQAWHSELQVRKLFEERIPEVWRKPCLEMVQFSTKKLPALVDDIHDWLLEHVVVGEIVTIQVKGDPERAKVLEVVPQFSQSNPENPAELNEWPKQTLYRVHLCTHDGAPIPPNLSSMEAVEYLVSLNAIQRNRQAYSKANLRVFVTENAHKDVWTGAPWIIRPELCDRYSITTTPPFDVKQAIEVHDGKAEPVDAVKKKKEDKKENLTTPKKANQLMSALNLPVEDLELLSLPPRPDQVPIARPTPSADFGAVPQACVPDLLVVWSFLSVFGKSLHLSSFSLDDFMNALSYKGSKTSALLIETFGCLLHVACVEWAYKIDAAIKATPQSPTFIIDTTGIMPPEHKVALRFDEEVRPTVEACDESYMKLSVDERASLDQWWKWYPGRWHNGMDGHKPSVAAALANTKSERSIPNSKRMRAWEVVLAGLIRDWIPHDSLPCKWTLLALLLGGAIGSRGGKPPAHSASDEEEVLEPACSPSLDGLNDDVESVPDSQVNGSASRKRTADTPDTTSHIDSDEEQPVLRKSARQKKPRLREETPELPEPKPTLNVSLRERRSTRTVTPDTSKHTEPAAPPAPTPPPVAKKPKAPPKAARPLDIDHLLNMTQHGFRCMTVEEKLAVLKALIQDCCMTSTPVRESLENSYRRIAEIKMEKREVSNQLKALGIAKRDLKKSANTAAAAEGSLAFNKTTVALLKQNAGSGDGGVSNQNHEDDSSELSDHTLSSAENSSDDDSASVATGSDDQMSRKRKGKARAARKRSKKISRTSALALTNNESSSKRTNLSTTITNMAEERRRLEEEEEKLVHRQNFLDEELRRQDATTRIRSLGRDRYFNRYWWYDAFTGAMPPGSEPPPPPPPNRGHKARPIDPVILEWGAGRLFIEEYAVGDPNHPIRGSATEADKEAALIGNTTGDTVRWSYYSNPEDMDRFLAYLNPRGQRESALLMNISKLQPLIRNSLVKRTQDLETRRLQRSRQPQQQPSPDDQKLDSANAESNDVPEKPVESSASMASSSHPEDEFHLDFLNKEAGFLG
ncbi:hypothetical protein SeMB42_g04877 [Synchytrium endobioticum]|uniref:WAC domain-containing protein n=1 Tax=Synchytrium endobioticum TaxID=286115 RepID=A0A507CWF9_9FUNG|nr:hypothetical protein SeMB42_g04877 [Synchytrium endobioticum]TPX43458.1 hypothetical protein SeLEV6574_g05050 [Synchytrium endobioticum]